MIKTIRLGISNMHCSNCSNTVENHFNNQEHIKVNVFLSDNEGIFKYDDAYWNEAKIKKELKKIGYPVSSDKRKIF